MLTMVLLLGNLFIEKTDFLTTIFSNFPKMKSH